MTPFLHKNTYQKNIDLDLSKKNIDLENPKYVINGYQKILLQTIVTSNVLKTEPLKEPEKAKFQGFRTTSFLGQIGG